MSGIVSSKSNEINTTLEDDNQVVLCFGISHQIQVFFVASTEAVVHRRLFTGSGERKNENLIFQAGFKMKNQWACLASLTF